MMIGKIVMLAVACILLVACESELGGIDLTASNNGQAIDVNRNQMIDIKLDSNITTGFKWALFTEPNSNILKLVSSKYNAPQGSTAVGASGSETWQFQAVGTGTTTLKLGYARPWESRQPIQEFTLTVNVQ